MLRLLRVFCDDFECGLGSLVTKGHTLISKGTLTVAAQQEARKDLSFQEISPCDLLLGGGTPGAVGLSPSSSLSLGFPAHEVEVLIRFPLLAGWA